jgi:uncharacterized protein YdeI (YjbR/CyaY-like superfamily)
MGNVRDRAEQLHFTQVEEWDAWLAEHHARPDGVWLVSYKASTGKPAIDYEDAVCTALCYGWIDSTYRRIDDDRGALWWAPRRKGSVWAASNRARIARLEAEGRMTPAGRAAVERAKADGSWSILESVEALIVPDDLAAAFDARDAAHAQWEAMPPSAKRAYLLWVASAKRAETRYARVNATADAVAKGLRFEAR